MKTICEYLRKYISISLVITVGIVMYTIAHMASNGSIPPMTIKYFLRSVIGILIIMISLIPAIAYIDLLIVKAAQLLFSDFKHADKAGKVTIIVVTVILLLKKIVSLTFY
jgi:hypothetical protein